MTVSEMLKAALLWLLIIVPVFIAVPVKADDTQQTTFEVSPKRCVTLRQGQPCFVRVRLEWQSTELLQVCVYGLEDKELKCWTATASGEMVIPQTLPGTTEYKLINSAGVELSRASVSVSWVYRKKRSKRRWRLF